MQAYATGSKLLYIYKVQDVTVFTVLAGSDMACLLLHYASTYFTLYKVEPLRLNVCHSNVNPVPIHCVH